MATIGDGLVRLGVCLHAVRRACQSGGVLFVSLLFQITLWTHVMQEKIAKTKGDQKELDLKL